MSVVRPILISPDVCEAWEAHRAMQIILSQDPNLAANRVFIAAADQARDAFLAAFQTWTEQ